jgi:hypothetical protein
MQPKWLCSVERFYVIITIILFVKWSPIGADKFAAAVCTLPIAPEIKGR